MNKTILGIGECMIELSQAENGLLRKSFAGDVFNSLWYARVGLDDMWDVSFMSAVGTDPTSDQMVEFIEAAGIQCSDVRRLEDRHPGLYMIHLDGAERSFSYWRETSAARKLAADHSHLARSIGQAEVVYLSGITLAILPDEDIPALIAALEAARADGRTVAFDSNIRPALWPDKDRMKALIGKTAAVSSIVFPSFDDEQAAYGDATPQDTLHRYSGYGAGITVLKNGPGEVCIFEDEQSRIVPTPTVTSIVDTTGAGDSFNGAFLANYVQTKDVISAVRAGQECAGTVIGHHGALVPR